jgi:hypothetical protein
VPVNDAALDPVLSPDWKARAQFRARSRRSLYFHTKTVTCATEPRNLMTAEVFKDSCDWLQRVICEWRRGLLEDSRNHIKSYRSTIAIPQWLAIQRPDPEYDHPNEVARATAFLADHPHLRGTDMRIAIASESDKSAAKWIGVGKVQWETNPVLRWAYPELLWESHDGDPQAWSNNEIYLPGRTVIYRDGFLRAMGIKSKTSGGRVDLLLVDDLVSEESAESPTELAYRCHWLRSAMQLTQNPDRTDPEGSIVLYVNNRWGFDDPNSMVHDEMPDWPVWHRAAWVCGEHGRGNCGRQPSDAESTCTVTAEPLWKERHPNLDVIRADIGDYLFYTQWGNAPAQKAELDSELIVPFRLEVMGVEGVRQWCVVIAEQRDRESGDLICQAETIPLSQLRAHRISIDPAAADEMSEARKRGKTARWALTWQAFDPPTGRDFVLEARAHHWAPTEAVNQTFALWEEASRALGVKVDIDCEKVAAQTLMVPALHGVAAKRQIKLPEINMIPPARGPNKWGRIHKRVGNRLGQRGLYVKSGATMMLVKTETRHAPTGSMDLLDAIAQAEGKFLEMQGVDVKAGQRRKARILSRRRRMANAGVTGV